MGTTTTDDDLPPIHTIKDGDGQPVKHEQLHLQTQLILEMSENTTLRGMCHAIQALLHERKHLLAALDD
jgi:hypothetical protein